MTDGELVFTLGLIVSVVGLLMMIGSLLFLIFHLVFRALKRPEMYTPWWETRAGSALVILMFGTIVLVIGLAFMNG